MLYTVITKTKNNTPHINSGDYSYHKFMISAETDKEIKTKFKASRARHTILQLIAHNSNILEVF